MFISRKEYKEMQGKIEGLYKVIENYQKQCDRLRSEALDWEYAYDEMEDKLYTLQEQYDELEEQAKEYMEDIKYKAEQIKEELDSKDAYIEELEEALYEANPNHILVRGMEREEDVIEVEYRVKADEMLLLNAPQLLLEAPVAEMDEVKYHIVIERGLDMVSDVDEVIFLRELMSEVSEVSKRVEIEARIRRTKDKVRKPQIEKDEQRVAGRPPVPPKPKKKPSKKVC